MGIFAGAQSSILTYAFVSTRDGKIIGAQIVREEMFMYSALGHWPSIVNPQRVNLFAENGIDSCFLIKNDFDKIVGYYCAPFADIWKVRFGEHPTQYDQFGWGHGKYKPSQKQVEFLASEYGIHNILTDYIYGDNLFKLLRDIRTPAWIANYRSLPKDSLVLGP